MKVAYSLGHLAGMADQRKANATLHQSSFADQARRDFDAYAKMNEAQLNGLLREWRGERRTTPAKANILRVWRDNPTWTQAQVARACGVHKTYVGVVLKGAR